MSRKDTSRGLSPPRPPYNRRLFSLEGAPAIEKELRRRVRERLVERADESPGYGGLWRRTIEQRPPGMPVGEAVRFVLWHRTFHGAGVPGLPALVGLARAAAKKARALRAAVSAARDVR